MIELPFRFERRMQPEPNSGCWFWLGAVDEDGYGRIRVPKTKTRKEAVHRAVYEHYKGPIPAELTVDHTCKVRCCINPEHLEAVTNAVNSLRGEGPAALNARKTHCPQGHPLADAYLVNSAGRLPQRACRTCAKARQLAYYDKNLRKKPR